MFGLIKLSMTTNIAAIRQARTSYPLGLAREALFKKVPMARFIPEPYAGGDPPPEDAIFRKITKLSKRKYLRSKSGPVRSRIPLAPKNDLGTATTDLLGGLAISPLSHV